MTPHIYVSHIRGGFVFDPFGDRLGRVRDVLVVYRLQKPPRVVGMVVEIPGRRRVFVSINRITSITSGQVITTGIINVRRFAQRRTEQGVIAEILGRKVRFKNRDESGVIEDVAIAESAGDWYVSQVYIRKPKGIGIFGKSHTEFVDWTDVIEIRDPNQTVEKLIEAYSDLRPADLAATIMELPAQRMLEVVEGLSDERLADVLEEMPEPSQLQIVGNLADERAADVLDQMEPDDAADLIGNLSSERGEQLLQLMEPEEADGVRLLLSYAPNSAGGIMTNDPVIVSPDATVAEGIALIRRQDLAPALASMLCVVLPPYEPPTGRFLGVVHFQALLRRPPHDRITSILDRTVEAISDDTPAQEVSRVLASYNLLALPVIDKKQRLLGMITIDDVLDNLLPRNWRQKSGDHELAQGVV